MKGTKGILANPYIFEDLEGILDIARGETHPLLDWVTAAWRQVFPTLDLTQFKVEQWKDERNN